ncbi:non-heme iron oxygenase ferredoxin subunit [Litorivicinus sp.]|jgi:nitrite reductase/ring-hydroxylating ferredoxin subunit|nr:non-heme iron oxygenase ferredoxin subunit [Litorivicinus sp.]MDB9863174.1 non-heme iron oxygenase ferredoxin subunit [Litorivicinus sp.]MDC1207938.1 non-heme iron oxygenase ferredoxin subunit [Litorivicinus sp.]MDC1466341.1 non-heme iron oxygenase ferredoxin subunit [Litorivicinus sp.]|tara:strand:- start:8186 stop:8497 length:312 start_codon:yes stop_codon:yes gene_type:complete
MALIELCSETDLTHNEASRFTANGTDIALFRVEDNFYALDDMCSHGPGSLSEGYLEDFNIECDFHNGAFDIRTGEVTAPPCMDPVKSYVVVRKDGKVFIEIDD